MHDIYHLLAKSYPEFRHLSDAELAESADTYAGAGFAINSALTLIGNLALDATESEGYGGDDALRDMNLISNALRHLPRMMMALNHCSQSAEYVRMDRKKKRRLKMIDPETNDRWAEKSGEMITVDNVAFNRVTFIRDGYEFPCIFPLERFVKEFTFVSRGQGNEKRA